MKNKIRTLSVLALMTISLSINAQSFIPSTEIGASA
jgi:hypothetical protein